MTTLLWIICLVLADVGGTVNRGFKSQQTSIRIRQNETVLLPCQVEDLAVQTRVRWWRNEVLLADSDEPRLRPITKAKMWPNTSLEVTDVQPEDSGEYVCQASRPAPWGHITQVHQLEIMYPPSVHPVPESELEVNLGEEVDMTCVSKGIPLPVIAWQKEEEEIPLLVERPRLRFHAENRNLSGRYTCIAHNGIGEPASATIDLRIRYKPEIEVKKTYVHASPGIRTQLDCRVNAWPDAKVDWYFEGEKVPYSSRIVKHSSGSDHSLVIRNVRPADYGEYLCRASNSLGITETTVRLTGVANPAVFKKESHNVSKTTYNFIWEVDSYSPIIEYQFWFRKYTKGIREEWHKLFIPSRSDAIGPVHARSFNLTGLEEATHYEALVLSRNRYGWSRPSKVLRFATAGAPADIDEYDRPEPVQEEKIISVIQLASMSQHSPADSEKSGSPCGREIFLIMILPLLICASLVT